MPSLDFKGKSFIYTHHLGVPYRELLVVPEKSCPAPGRAPDLDDNLIIHGDNHEALAAARDKEASGKQVLVFAAAKYISHKSLQELGVDFAQLPYALHRVQAE